MELDHPTQKSILLKLIHNPILSFTELLGDERDSNRFAYHLATMEKKGLVIKQESRYYLTEEGKKLSAFIEGDTGSKAAFPTFANVLIIKKDGKFLSQKRLKEPFYGIWGLISGKVNYGWNIEECALRDLEEETGLKAKKANFFGVHQSKTYEDSKLLFHHIMFFVEMEGISGDLIKKTHKGENEWVTMEEFKKRERFPDQWFDAVFNTKGFIKVETKRKMKDGKFLDCDITTIKEH